MRIWRNRQTRWLRVASRQCIYNLYWLKRIFRFDICGVTCKKVHLGFGFEPCENFRLLYCGCGGIGRRAGFRCQSSQGGMGSSPFIRTIGKKNRITKLFIACDAIFYDIIFMTAFSSAILVVKNFMVDFPALLYLQNG